MNLFKAVFNCLVIFLLCVGCTNFSKKEECKLFVNALKDGRVKAKGQSKELFALNEKIQNDITKVWEAVDIDYQLLSDKYKELSNNQNQLIGKESKAYLETLTEASVNDQKLVELKEQYLNFHKKIDPALKAIAESTQDVANKSSVIPSTQNGELIVFSDAEAQDYEQKQSDFNQALDRLDNAVEVMDDIDLEFSRLQLDTAKYCNVFVGDL